MDYYNNQNYYDILGIDKSATISSIERAKDRLKFGDPDDRVPFSMWTKIDEAYSVLSNPEKRREYDKKLEESKTNTPPSPVAKNNIDLKNEYVSPEITIENQPITQDGDINFNPDHSSSSILVNEQQSLQGNSVVPHLKKLGKEVVLALPTAVIATISIIKKLNKKYALQQDQTKKQITDVKTADTELMEFYRKQLDEKIDKVLGERHLNYNLEIDKLRYENYIELLKKMIELKENEVVKKGGLLKYKLQLTALRRQLKVFEISLNNVNSKINSTKRPQRLSKIYDNLSQVNEKINEIELSSKKKVIALKKLQVRKNNLLAKKKLKIQKIKSNREYYAVFKDSIISAHAVTENFVDNLFVPMERIDERNR